MLQWLVLSGLMFSGQLMLQCLVAQWPVAWGGVKAAAGILSFRSFCGREFLRLSSSNRHRDHDHDYNRMTVMPTSTAH